MELIGFLIWLFANTMIVDAGVNGGELGNKVGHFWCDTVGDQTIRLTGGEKQCDANYLIAPTK